MSWESMLFWIEHHPGLASWVQAVGSIGAILGAFAISAAQSRRHEKLLRREASDRFDAYYAVVKNAAETSMLVTEFAHNKSADFEFRSVWEKYLGELLRASLDAAKAIPVHELEDYKLVVYYSGLMGTIYKLHHGVERYMSSRPSMEITLELYESMLTQSSMIQFDWKRFQERAKSKKAKR